MPRWMLERCNLAASRSRDKCASLCFRVRAAPPPRLLEAKRLREEALRRQEEEELRRRREGQRTRAGTACKAAEFVAAVTIQRHCEDTSVELSSEGSLRRRADDGMLVIQSSSSKPVCQRRSSCAGNRRAPWKIKFRSQGGAVAVNEETADRREKCGNGRMMCRNDVRMLRKRF